MATVMRCAAARADLAAQLQLIHQDPGRVQRLEAHHLGLEGECELAAEPGADALLHDRIVALRVEQQPVRVDER